MSRPISRRSFHTLALGSVARGVVAPKPGPPAPAIARTGRPVVIASGNGGQFTNGGERTGVEVAFAQLTAGGDPLDAVIAGVNVNELDPRETSVGYGGLPNADGVVQLDASCFHGPTRRAGAVACLEGVRAPSHVAKAVMMQTDHHLLVGPGAQAFARQLGFAIEADLNTETSRQRWLEWKRQIDPDHWLDPARRESAASHARDMLVARGLIDPEHLYGTIHMAALAPSGAMGSVTTTSGLAFKIPGRVGDSPILGAGNYLDQAVGSAGSTGRGEANLFGLSSFLIVDEMRRGTHPKDAIMIALRRIAERTHEPRLLDPAGLPKFNVSFYAMTSSGAIAAASLRPNPTGGLAVCDENGKRIVSLEPLIP